MTLFANGLDRSPHGLRFRSANGLFTPAPVEVWIGRVSEIRRFNEPTQFTCNSPRGVRVGLKHISKDFGAVEFGDIDTGRTALTWDNRVVYGSPSGMQVLDPSGRKVELLFSYIGSDLAGNIYGWHFDGSEWVIRCVDRDYAVVWDAAVPSQLQGLAYFAMPDGSGVVLATMPGTYDGLGLLTPSGAVGWTWKDDSLATDPDRGRVLEVDINASGRIAITGEIGNYPGASNVNLLLIENGATVASHLIAEAPATPGSTDRRIDMGPIAIDDTGQVFYSFDWTDSHIDPELGFTVDGQGGRVDKLGGPSLALPPVVYDTSQPAASVGCAYMDVSSRGTGRAAKWIYGAPLNAIVWRFAADLTINKELLVPECVVLNNDGDGNADRHLMAGVWTRRRHEA